ncbi:2Fe-2S iron-sulfur cluster-binding protein [Bartonella sp. HY329]|uniref:2Fe-2S iron-sulfur cluster-binding protein n=1 Tax=unclassified Bartonella TaxID=2645622 RepID=UPI0021C6A53F|nr:MULTISPECIES: 2Fe-2S iron-sulfur cluster-binding protein [unclassified Bartonella]UXM94065.1 2Fe-2S iron-sulfur cluster-binding protein [Bartonella sp. HY329]UXN08387.1 2Fe-2S iron-sulfur cluster-binding protein [Bartonella sp. HY328]
MVKILFITLPEMKEIALNGEIGTSLMELAVINDVKGIIGECGGACSCATCHVYISDEWSTKLPDATTMENDMLDFVDNVKENSRLACQIFLTADLNGLKVFIP